MQINIIRSASELKEIESQWNDMLSDSDFKTPFFSAVWYQKWLECFGAGKAPFVVGAWNADRELLAVAPLVKTETSVLGIRIREITFMYNSIAPRSSVIYRQGSRGKRATEAIFFALMRHSDDWDCIRLVNVDASLPYIAALEGMVDRRKFAILIREARISPYVKIEGSFEQYFRNEFNSKQRNDIRRNIKKFHSHTDCAIVKYTKVQDIPVALDLSFRVSRASWKGKIGTDMGSSLEKSRFYRDISITLAQSDQIAIWIALYQDIPIAIQYHLVADRTAYLLITDFDERYASLSPGTALLYHVIADLHAENFSEFDLSGDAFEYKLRWTQDVRKHINIRIYNNNPRSRMMYYYNTKLLPLYKAITRHNR